MSALLSPSAALEYHLRNHPDFTAVSDDSGDYSYQRLGEDIHRVINGFESLGLTADDRVAVISKNRYEGLVMILAALMGGPVVVPVNRRIALDEMLWIIRDSQATAVLADAEVAEGLDAELRDFVPESLRLALDPDQEGWTQFSHWLADQSAGHGTKEAQPDRNYLQIYTSGTSGRPKGVVLSEKNCLGQLFALLATVDVNLVAGETMYEALPLFHVGGVFVSIWALSRGAHLLYRQDFVPQEADDLLSSGQVQHATMVPAMIHACLTGSEKPAEAYRFLKTVMYGASPIARSTLCDAVTRYGCEFLQVYGMTETHSVISVLTAADHKEIVANPHSSLVESAGRPVVGTVLSITDSQGNAKPQGQVGEIRVSSQHVMTGYWNNPQATEESMSGSFLCTGDAGFVDERGYLYIVDRLKDIIVSGGENISSLEVESALLRHPDVADVAVIGVPDPQWGEAVTALVVSQDERIDGEALKAYCKAELGGLKAPKTIHQVDAIPRNAAGKILKAQLRKDFWGGELRNVS